MTANHGLLVTLASSRTRGVTLAEMIEMGK